ncbi:MAG: DUF6503 family protein [Bacteroidota bacterium]
MNLSIIITSILLLIFPFKKEMSGEDLLNRSIAFHDPKGKWECSKIKLSLKQTTPNKEPRLTECKLDNKRNYFWQQDSRGDKTTTRSFTKGTCQHWLNGNKDFSEEAKKENRLDCKWTQFWHNYQSYLYGLPMKLKDPGTIVHNKVEAVEFYGQNVLKLKVTYEPEVGKDTWYFYFDPTNFALVSYQFFHDESKNDGEYILLDGLTKGKGMQLPKSRKWYYNKDGKFLGEDVLTSLK